MLCYAVLCYAMLCYAMLCYAMLCDAMLCDAMRCYAMLCDAMRCYAMLCDAMRCDSLGSPAARWATMSHAGGPNEPKRAQKYVEEHFYKGNADLSKNNKSLSKIKVFEGRRVRLGGQIQHQEGSR